MKKVLLVAMLVLGFSIVAVAQDTPAAEVFGGYSYVRPDTQGGDVDLNMNGWNLSVGIPGNKYLGFVADFGGLYAKEGSNENDEIKYRAYTAMFGPKVTVRLGKVTPFVQALFGYARLTGRSFQEVQVLRENDFAYTIGGGIDVNLNSLVAIRPVQVDYLGIKSNGDMTHNFRYSAGVVLKLGKR
jgi:opacity protein-like surface antigen